MRIFIIFPYLLIFSPTILGSTIKKVDDSKIFELIASNNVKACRDLISQKDFNIEIICDNYKTTPLIASCKEPNVEIVLLLLRKGANVNAATRQGWTPLHYACSHANEKQLCELLIEHGARVDAQSDEEQTPLFFAARNPSAEVCELLLKNGAQVNMRDDRGRTPLHYASLSGYEENCKILLKYRAEIDAQDNAGRTPLHFSADEGKIDVCIFLLGQEIKHTIKDESGLTPLDYAVGSNHTFIAKMLRMRSIDNGYYFKDSSTPVVQRSTYRPPESSPICSIQ